MDEPGAVAGGEGGRRRPPASVAILTYGGGHVIAERSAGAGNAQGPSRLLPGGRTDASGLRAPGDRDLRHDTRVRRRDYLGPVLCALGALCLLAGLSIELGSSAAKALMVLAAALFVPGAYVTLATARRISGPPR